MRTVQVIKNGGPELLTLADVPVPSAGQGDVLVRIKAAGAKFIDVYFREGRSPATCPLILGQEAAGIVVEPGSMFKAFTPIVLRGWA
jgi:NADPH2:quinone reductase